MVLKGLILPGGCAEPSDGRHATWTGDPLRPVANRPVVGHVLEELRGAGVDEVLVALPGGRETDRSEHLAMELRACVEAERPAGLDVEYLPGAAGGLEQALANAAPVLGEAACVVHAADGLLAQPLAPLTALLREGSPDLVALVHGSPAGAGSIGLATRRLLRLAGSQEEGAVDLAGVYLLGPGALRQVGETEWCRNRRLDLVPMAERLAAAGGTICVKRVRGWFSAGGSTPELLELNRIALDTLCPSEAPAGEGSRIEGNVEVHPTACVQSSTIVGPAIVGAGALVLDSYIGPYTSIGAGARVEGAEVERSIVLEGASITHIGGRLVGSLVGREARIFRDFSLPRALRMTVGDGNEVALC
jgi:glucose-1-phosphate thymidylyltransferase